jgi:hypothetical protein
MASNFSGKPMSDDFDLSNAINGVIEDRFCLPSTSTGFMSIYFDRFDDVLHTVGIIKTVSFTRDEVC